MAQQNAMLLRRAVEEIWNGGNYAVVDELIAGDYLGHASTSADETHGREGYKRFIASLRDAFPDIRFTIEDQIAAGDKVVTRWSARATHTGEFRGIPPTGKQGRVTGITIDRVADGKVVECWTNADDLGLLQQLGVLPAPGPADR
jgi:steroid delta-isomerase-like uncharacterized protein